MNPFFANALAQYSRSGLVVFLVACFVFVGVWDQLARGRKS